MAKRRGTSATGRTRLQGPRLFDVTARRPARWGRSAQEGVQPMVLANGARLNIPETIIYRALTGLGVLFEAQKSIAGGRQLGGGLIDFWLPQEKTVIEYQGPFHRSDTGVVRDFWREVARKQFGATRILYVYEADLERIHARLRELLGGRG